MTTPSKVFERATEGGEHPHGGDRLVPIASAIIAVLAAVGSLLGHHASIQALDIKNRALQETVQASDQFTYYQTKRVRAGIYSALLTAGVARDAQTRANLKDSLDHEQTSSLAVLADAKKLEADAALRQDAAEVKLHAFETFEIATATFEIAIVLASIAALTQARPLLWIGIGLSAFGVVMLLVGFVSAH